MRFPVASVGLVVAMSLAPPATAADWLGKASYYAFGPRSRTAFGHAQTAMSAAHRDLPFGAKVRVTNLANGYSVIVTVVDRGPFVRGRVIDVSIDAARQLGFVGRGVANVRVSTLP